MFGTGVSSGFIAKLAGLGSAAKVGVAATTAALTLTVTGGTAALVMKDGGASAPAVVQVAGGGSRTASAAAVSPATVESTGEVAAGTEASAPTSDASSSARARAEVTTPTVPTTGAAPAVTPSVPASVPLVGGIVPDLSALAGLPADVLACLTPILDLVGQLPNVPLDQITSLGTAVVNCVTGIVEEIPLPFGLNGCISGILGFVGSIVSSLPFGVPNLGSLDIGACIPSGLPIPNLSGFFSGIPFLGGGGIPFLGGFPGQ